MTPLERAARAVRLKLGAEFHPESGCWMTDGGLVDGDEFTDIARAVLQSIREPSEGMCAAGYNAGNWHDTVPLEGDGSLDATPVWHAMIDAALEEQPPA